MRYIAVLVTLAAVFAGCATATPTGHTPVDITGAWTGSWEGYGVFDIKRNDNADANFEQNGKGGSGRLWLEGILASESVPLSMRLAGANGVPVFYEVNGNRVVLRDVRDERRMMAEFAVDGDRMVGRILTTAQPARIVLERVKPRVALPTPTPEPAPAPTQMVAAAPPPPPAEPVRPAPTPARPAPQEFSPTDGLKSVYFAFDRAELEPSQATVMDGNVQWLQANPALLVIVEGHCDERGTNAYNLALGERRARTVRDYFLSHGVAADRITVLSYGEERPTCRDKNEGCWKDNRRASFVIKPKE